MSDDLPPGLGPDSPWTTVNASEALPGVVTPLTWSYFAEPLELGLRLSFHELGVLTGAELVVPPVADRRFLERFHGRIALNIDMFRMAADRIPGTSGDALAEQLFAAAPAGPDGGGGRGALERYPVIAARLPLAAARVHSQVHGLRDETERLWRATVATPPADVPAALAVIRQAQDALRRNFHWHGVGTFLAQGCFDRLGRLTAAVGQPGLELSLLAGFTTFEEQRLVEDLRTLAGGGLGLEEFLAEHGFHGQGAAELAVPSWRVDPAGLRRTTAAYRDRPPAAGARAAHADAMTRLRAAARGPRWAEARVLLAAGRRFMPLREVGRSGVLRCADTARLAAAVVASRLVDRGRLADPADVVYLNLDELASGEVTPELVEERRRAHTRHRAVELPERWTGAPSTGAAAAPTGGTEAGELTGIPAGPGVVEGLARVVLDPDEADQDLADGEVLVCHATDPSWAAAFTLAVGLVIDIGSALSHGAILARELGLPCVINTRTGTSRIRTGDRVRVDGTTGTVTVLEPLTPQAA